MNRCKQPSTAKATKRKEKEVHVAMCQATTLPSQRSPITSRHKNPSKRTKEIREATPAHAKQEGSRWAEVLRKQTEENTARMSLNKAVK